MTKTNPFSVCALSVLAVLFCAGPNAVAQGKAAATTVYTLGPDEEILRAESTIEITAEAADVILVLAKDRAKNPPFFVFRDGKKTGPYASVNDAMNAAYAGRAGAAGGRSDCAVYDPGDPPDSARPEPAQAAGGKMVVRFKGKTFGPYMMVLQASATPDGATAFYIAGDSDKSWFGCSDGRVVAFGGMPENMKFSPDGKNGAVVVKGKLSLTEMNDLSKLPPEKMAAAMKDLDKSFLYTIDGRSFGPFDDNFGSSSFWYPKTSNDLYCRVRDDVLRNGALLFKADSFDSCNFYPSPDGKSYAMFTYESIVFSDGQSYPSPLDVLVVARAGRTVFRWISLENEKRLVVYERTM